MSDVSKFEVRKARIKIDLLNEVLKGLENSKFDDININKICADSGISKVTYFKYFPNKGDILLYFMSIWNYRIEIETIQRSLSGVKAIQHAFMSITRIDNHMKIMTGLIGFISGIKEKPNQYTLSRLEKKALFPDIDEQLYQADGKPLDIFFAHHLNTAVQDGDLDGNVNIEEYVVRLLTVFYGTPFTLFSLAKTELDKYYSCQLKSILPC